MGKSKKHQALGAYVFAGGFTIGMSKHFDIVGHLEDGNFGVPTFQANFPDIPVHTRPQRWPLQKYAGVPVIYANPPCSPWSAAGKQKGGSDENTRHVVRMAGLAGELQPKIWVWESVTNAYLKGGDFLDRVTGQLLEDGYSVTYFLHDVKTMGMPQQRRRVLVIGSKIEIDFKVPRHQMQTCGPALEGIEPDWVPVISPKWTELFPMVKPGKTLRDVWDEVHDGQSSGRPGFLYRRLDPDKPSGSILGGATLIHPYEDRMLSPAEAAILCGFPKSYKWEASNQKKYERVGKTVTPPLGNYLGRTLSRALDDDVPIRQQRVEVINYQCVSPRLDDFRIKNERELLWVDEGESYHVAGFEVNAGGSNGADTSAPASPDSDHDEHSSDLPAIELLSGPVEVDGHEVIMDPRKLARELAKDKVIAFDTETTGLNPLLDRIAVVQLYGEQSGTLGLVQTHIGIPDEIKDVLQRKDKPTFVMHNGVAYDLIMLKTHGIDIEQMKVYDTLVGEPIVMQQDRADISKSLRASIKRRLGIKIDKDIEHSDWLRPDLSGKQIAYAVRDVLHLPALMHWHEQKCDEVGMSEALAMEMQLVPYTALMTYNGLPLDLDALEEYRQFHEERLEEASQLLEKELPQVNNWNSPAQIKEALHEYGVPVPNTKKETLLDIAMMDGGKTGEVCEAIIVARQALKRGGMYDPDWVQKHVINGRVHSRFWQVGTDTTRYASSDPNLQQIPRDMRRIFGLEGHTMVSPDYSQIEVRIAAAIAQDAVMLKLLESEDVHTAVAMQVMGLKKKEVTPALRKHAKAMSFTLLFGGGPQALYDYARMGGSDISYDEAASYVNRFFDTFTGLRAARQKAQNMADKKRVISIRLPNGMRRNLAGRKVKSTIILNTMVQGSAAVGIKKAMLLASKEGCFDYLGAQVHDELVACVPNKEAADFRATLIRCMKEGMAEVMPGMPVAVEDKYGKVWQK